MTREKALEVEHLLVKIEAYEALIDELYDLQTVNEIKVAYGEDLEPELTAVVQAKLDILKKELEEM
jgi:LPS sulfotransferase NodH